MASVTQSWEPTPVSAQPTFPTLSSNQSIGTSVRAVLEPPWLSLWVLEPRRTCSVIQMIVTRVKISQSMNSLTLSISLVSLLSSLTSTEDCRLYYAARSSGVWGSGHYAMTDFKEYFAEGVQSFFDTNAYDAYAPTTRNQLRSKDPNLYNFIVQYLGNNPWRRSC